MATAWEYKSNDERNSTNEQMEVKKDYRNVPISLFRI